MNHSAIVSDTITIRDKGRVVSLGAQEVLRLHDEGSAGAATAPAQHFVYYLSATGYCNMKPRVFTTSNCWTSRALVEAAITKFRHLVTHMIEMPLEDDDLLTIEVLSLEVLGE